MVRAALFLIVGLVLGIFIGISAEGSALTEPMWAFVGVLVGASVTIFIEHLRSDQAHRRKVGDWKLDAYSRTMEATTELERASGTMLAIRLESLNRQRTFPTVHQLSEQSRAFGQALLTHAMIVGPHLGAELNMAASKFREATVSMAYYKPDYLDAWSEIDDDGKEKLLGDIKKQTQSRLDRAEEFQRLLHDAIALELAR